VNVAFAGYLQFFWDSAEEEFRRVTEVTYLGQVHGTHAALQLLRPRNSGVIVNVGSAMGFRGIPLQAAYGGAKHAVKGCTESVMTELAHEKSKVRVCMVQLPGLNTTILGERLAPKLLDLYLGRSGVKSQQTDRQLPRWRDNLATPRDGEADRGAHGPFGDQAHERDPLTWLSSIGEPSWRAWPRQASPEPPRRCAAAGHGGAPLTRCGGGR
jgi:NAD(P)-dependent dehydrogenase (short-subunit alcohol dehydrogenase family)